MSSQHPFQVQRRQKEFMFLLQSNPVVQQRRCGQEVGERCDWDQDLEAKLDLELNQHFETAHLQVYVAPSNESSLSLGAPDT